MKITYDKEVDALYIRFKRGTATSEQIAPGMAIDRDAEGFLVGIEILDASKKIGEPLALQTASFEEYPDRVRP